MESNRKEKWKALEMDGFFMVEVLVKGLCFMDFPLQYLRVVPAVDTPIVVEVRDRQTMAIHWILVELVVPD